MKKKNGYILLSIRREGKEDEIIKISADELKQTLKHAKIGKDAEDVELQFVTENEKMLTIPMRVSGVQTLIKSAELMVNLVPIALEKYLIDVSQKFAKKQVMPLIGRDNEIEKIWFYLSQKTRNNVFLVGETEVGKTAIAAEVARQLATNQCPKEFFNKRVIEFNPEKILRIEKDFLVKKIVKKIFNFLVINRKKIVLYVDKALFMKTDYWLVRMLYALIIQYKIPFITTCSTEDFDDYFLPDDMIAKYLNEVYVEEPELEELQPMIKNHIESLEKKYKVQIDDNMIKFGIYTSCLSESPSCNPGNVISIFEKAFLETKRKGKKNVDKQAILSCYNTYLKLYNNTSEDQKRMIAYHETGHYIVSQKCLNVKDEKIAFVSILPMMDFLGVNWPYKITGKTLNYSREYYIDQIAMYLGGRLGERLLTNKDSTGACSDLDDANTIARNMIMYYGLSKDKTNKNRSYINEYGVREYLISNEKKDLLDKEIQDIINEGAECAETILKENKELFEIVAEKLLKEEILTGEQLEQICKEHEKSKK